MLQIWPVSGSFPTPVGVILLGSLLNEEGIFMSVVPYVTTLFYIGYSGKYYLKCLLPATIPIGH